MVSRLSGAKRTRRPGPVARERPLPNCRYRRQTSSCRGAFLRCVPGSSILPVAFLERREGLAWAAFVGLVVSGYCVAAGMLGRFHFEATDTALFDEFRTTPLLTWGLLGGLVSLGGLVWAWAALKVPSWAGTGFLIVVTIVLAYGAREYVQRSQPEPFFRH